MALTIIRSLKAPLPTLKHLIHQRVAGWEDPRPHFPLRASDLLSTKGEFCPREGMFLDMGVAQKKGSFVGTSLRMTFNHGSYMERQIRDVYLRDLVVGQWGCSVCKHVHPTFGKSPIIKCPKCGYGNRWEYQEPRFEDDESGVSGGIDMLLDIGQPKLLIVEIKTMSPDEFKTLVAPLAEHKMRTSLYLKLAETSKWDASERVNTKESKILYVTKSFGFKDETLKAAGIKDAAFSPFKEFTITRNDDLLSVPLAKARVLKVYRDDNSKMPAGVCSNGLCKRAQGCPAVAACFSGSYPSQTTWLDNGVPKHPGKILVT